ncbi:hypothetical protein A4G26_03440 [Mycobacterium kansasii]|uniref:Uncharacterized protein n=1 Tax=Mycobacterium innocens TaxID=2341083 RepID=A0A498QIF3_9MYCO|nr:hypothetical protein A4G26_03440 [Mycobacterium kansasii]VBA44818.1 hypothetical protein LAUMK13_05214 [Mycobacterium innocens]
MALPSESSLSERQRPRSNFAPTSSGSAWAKIALTAAVAHRSLFAGNRRVQVVHQMDSAPLPRCSVELLGHTGFQSGVGIGDDQMYPHNLRACNDATNSRQNESLSPTAVPNTSGLLSIGR